MKDSYFDDTIAAISTPIGEGGIGIVRISGRDALRIADRIFVSRDRKRPSKMETYTIHYGYIRDRQQATGKRRQRGGDAGIVDEVILTIMRAPRSYTKEDVVEINCHSGIVPLRKILDIVLANGARPAEPGEFTKRAFLNGRIDIMQAEAVLGIIKAATELSLRAAVNNLRGVFSYKVNGIRDGLLNILADIEASIDFSEEEDVVRRLGKAVERDLKALRKRLNKLLEEASEGRVLRYGLRLAICGSPNVGKSSIMNAILKESRAIVTHIPGTTRDTIEETVNIKGVPVVLVDTAGIRESRHPVEREGVLRSERSIDAADIILFVIDGSRPIKRADRRIINKIKARSNVIIVINKTDLPAKIDVKEVKKFFRKQHIVFTSAITLKGIDVLEKAIIDCIFKGKIPVLENAVLSSQRQIDSIRRTLQELNEAISAIKNNTTPECLAVILRSAIQAIGEVSGHAIGEEALNRIFSQFCIGK